MLGTTAAPTPRHGTRPRVSLPRTQNCGARPPDVHLTTDVHEEGAIGLLQRVEILQELLPAVEGGGHASCHPPSPTLAGRTLPQPHRPYLSMTSNASSVPMMQRALTAAYVGARWGCWPGPPPKPPWGLWQRLRNWQTLWCRGDGQVPPHRRGDTPLLTPRLASSQLGVGDGTPSAPPPRIKARGGLSLPPPISVRHEAPAEEWAALTPARDTKLSFGPDSAGTAPGGTSGITRVASAAGCPLGVSACVCVCPPTPSSRHAGVTYSEATDWGMGSSSSSRLCRIQ